MLLDLINKIKVKLLQENTQQRLEVQNRIRNCPPLSNLEIAATTTLLGFQPPKLLVDIYQNISDGGFGPGYGLMGLHSGHKDDNCNTGPELYRSFAQVDPEDTAWIWPTGLLPICHWGCAIYSCVDCNSETAEVYIWDPNAWESGNSPKTAIWSAGRDLHSWLTAWTDDVDLWGEMYEQKDTVFLE